ncbi:MAG: YihY/virulence factor BrkB family protein [Candidatus Hydrogenedentes bacterium]|nr:YihY/virulence factor BrkB family protein [Candidatus Hydrogenedentota bacterium]
MPNYLERSIDALKRGRQFVVHDVWRIGLPGEDIPGGLIIKQIRVVILLITNLAEGSLLLRASALTFATLLSIVPFLAVMFYVIQTFNLGEGVYEVMRVRLERAVEQASEIIPGVGDHADAEALTEEDVESDLAGELEVARSEDAESVPADEENAVEARGPPDATSDEQVGMGASEEEGEESDPSSDGESQTRMSRALQDELTRTFFRGVGQQNDDMQDPIEWLVALADEAATDPRALSVSGVVLLFTTVFGLMRNIEKSFNGIWGVRRTRSWYRTVSDYIMITLLLPVVAAVVLGASAALRSESIAASLGPLAYSVQGIQYAVIVFVFAILYYGVPSTHVRFTYALFGGVIAGLLWVLLSWVYVEFQVGLARYNLIFATFAQFPMLLMWIYFSWCILLFGAELSFAYQNEKTFAMERFADGASFAYREALGLRTMLEVGRRFQDSESGMSRETVAEEWNVPSRLVNESLDHLEEAGLITACATEPVTYTPSRPLDRISVGQVIHALREVGHDPSLFRKDETYRELFDELGDTEHLFDGASLSELIARLPDAVAETDTAPNGDEDG